MACQSPKRSDTLVRHRVPANESLMHFFFVENSVLRSERSEWAAMTMTNRSSNAISGNSILRRPFETKHERLLVSFHELQELFLFSHAQGNLDDEELLLLYKEYSPKNPDFCHENFGRFSLDDVNDAECLAEFRFRKHDLSLLAEVLQIPHSFTCEQRTVSSGMEALCILRIRLSYPCRFSDIIPRFGRPVPVLSMVSNQVLDFIYDTHGHRITQ